MKRKISIMILAAMAVASLSACGADTPSNSTTPSDPPAQQTEQQEQPQETAEVAQDAFEQFKAALDAEGYTYKVTTMGAELVGAERGEKYTFDFGSVELYRFPEGAEALTTGEVTLEGFGNFPIEVNGNYGLVVSLDENEDAIKAIFAGL